MQRALRRVDKTIFLAILVLLTFVTSARASGLLLYETGAPDLGTASAGRTAMASDASTVAANPAGMSLLDRSQLLGAAGALLPFTNFDSAPETTTSGGSGGNAGVFFPIGSFFYVHKLSERIRLGFASDSDFGRAADGAGEDQQCSSARRGRGPGAGVVGRSFRRQCRHPAHANQETSHRAD